jgi:hypothetical protein
MAVTINASTSAGLVQSADTTGNLNIQSNGSTIVAVTSSGAAVTGTLSSTGDGSISGRLGVGAAASATYPLNLSQNTNNFVRFLAGSSRVWRLGADGANAGAGTFSLVDDSAGATRWTVDAAGAFGVGTTTPSSFGQIATRAAITGINPFGVTGGVSLSLSDAVSSTFYMVHETASGYLFMIGNAGRTYVQTNSGGGVYLASGGNTWTSVSDERKKEIIEPITGAATKVSSLRAVIGRYLNDAEDARRPFLIAQDVQKVLPEAVDSADPDDLGLAYSNIIPLLVAAIKEQTEQIKTLTDRIAALESKQ